MAPGRKLAIVAPAVIGVGAGGVGVTQAVSGEANQASASKVDHAAEAERVAETASDDSDPRVSGREAERAERAAVDAAGGGRVVVVEREEARGVAWEVEVVQRDGREVEVDLSRSFERVAIDPQDTSAEDEREKADDDGAREVREGSGDD